MGAIVTARSSLSIAAWDALLSPLLHPGSGVNDVISELRPLFIGADDRSTGIQLLHQSFRDYLKWRISNDVFPTLDSVKDHERLALRCFQVINAEIPKVADLGMIERLGHREVIRTISHGEVSEELGYACLFALDHTLETKEASEAAEVEIKKFLDESITNWVELCVRTKTYISIGSFFDWIEVS